MKVILLYGPPAAGKLTISKILQQETGFALLHNHLLQNPITEVFPFDNPANSLLVREFRLRIIEEAVKSNINLIVTFGVTGNNPFSHVADVVNMVEEQNAEILLVHLIADKNIILDRVEDKSRKDYGKSLSKEKLSKIIKDYPDMFNKFSKHDHLTIDTSKSTPEEVVDKITESYKLTR